MQSIPPTATGQPLPVNFAYTGQGQLVNSSQHNTILYKQKSALLFGIIQMIVGILCAVFNIVSLIVCSQTYGCNGPYICGYGIWCGILFFITGTLGMFSGRGKPRKSLIIATMTMSIIAALCSIITFSLGIIDSATRASPHDHYHPDNYGPIQRSNKYDTRVVLYQPGALIAMGTLLAIISWVEAIAAITSSALCCKAVCCGDNVSITYVQVHNPALQQPTYYSPTGYVPQYGPPENNAYPTLVNPTAPPHDFPQQQMPEGNVEFPAYNDSDLPPPYSECQGEKN